MPTVDSTARSGVYAIRHLASGKVYIGSSSHVPRRLQRHRGKLESGTHINRYLQAAWNKHGADAFVFEMIQPVEAIEDLLKVEQEHLDRFESYRRSKGYNASRVAGSPMTGRRLSAKQRAQISAAHKGKTLSPETRAKMSEAWTGKPKSPEHVEKMAATKRGKTLSPEHVAKIAAASTGRTHTAEAKEKIAASKRGKPRSAETRAKVSAAKKGKPGHLHSDETRARMAEARRAYWAARKAQAIQPTEPEA